MRSKDTLRSGGRAHGRTGEIPPGATASTTTPRCGGPSATTAGHMSVKNTNHDRQLGRIDDEERFGGAHSAVLGLIAASCNV
jgi:hypothetical protein